jgi:hypothetical protein
LHSSPHRTVHHRFKLDRTPSPPPVASRTGAGGTREGGVAGNGVSFVGCDSPVTGWFDESPWGNEGVTGGGWGPLEDEHAMLQANAADSGGGRRTKSKSTLKASSSSAAAAGGETYSRGLRAGGYMVPRKGRGAKGDVRGDMLDATLYGEETSQPEVVVNLGGTGRRPPLAHGGKAGVGGGGGSRLRVKSNRLGTGNTAVANGAGRGVSGDKKVADSQIGEAMAGGGRRECAGAVNGVGDGSRDVDVGADVDVGGGPSASSTLVAAATAAMDAMDAATDADAEAAKKAARLLVNGFAARVSKGGKDGGVDGGIRSPHTGSPNSGDSCKENGKSVSFTTGPQLSPLQQGCSIDKPGGGSAHGNSPSNRPNGSPNGHDGRRSFSTFSDRLANAPLGLAPFTPTAGTRRSPGNPMWMLSPATRLTQLSGGAVDSNVREPRGGGAGWEEEEAAQHLGAMFVKDPLRPGRRARPFSANAARQSGGTGRGGAKKKSGRRRPQSGKGGGGGGDGSSRKTKGAGTGSGGAKGGRGKTGGCDNTGVGEGESGGGSPTDFLKVVGRRSPGGHFQGEDI